jgi:hypothetical protein
MDSLMLLEAASRQSAYVGVMLALHGLHHSQLSPLLSGADVRLVPVPQEEDPETYQTHFASYIANDLDGDSLEDKYKEVRLRRLGSCTGRFHMQL